MVSLRIRTLADAPEGVATEVSNRDASPVKSAGCFKLGLGCRLAQARSSSASGLQDAAAEQTRWDAAPVPASSGMHPKQSASSALASKQPAVARTQGDPNQFRGDSAYREWASRGEALGVAAMSTPAVAASARSPAHLQPASPELSVTSERSFATAFSTNSTSSSGGGGGGGADVGSGGNGGGTSGCIPEPDSPRVRAIDAFVRHRSMACESASDRCQLRANSTGTARWSTAANTISAWLRSGSGSIASKAAARGHSSLGNGFDSRLRTGSAGNLGTPGSKGGGGEGFVAGRSGLSLHLRRGSSHGTRQFSNPSTLGSPGLPCSGAGSRAAEPPSGGTDAACCWDARSTLPAPLHLFTSEPPHQGGGAVRAAPNLLPPCHRYQRLMNLSSGSCGSADLCLDTESDTPVVIRFLQRGPAVEGAAVRRQLAFHWRAACHANVVQLLNVFALPEHLALVMQWANGGDLRAYITSYTQDNGTGIPEKDARRVMRQLLTAVQFAHQNGCSNSGVKLEDVLLHVDPESPGDVTVKLLCGGVGGRDGMFSPSNVRASRSLPNYYAPEALHSRQYDARHADAWCCGVVMYMLLAGAFPFLTARETRAAPMVQLHAKVQRIVSGRFLSPIRSVTPSCSNLLMRLLNPDPDLRITLGEALQHPWIAADPVAAAPQVATPAPDNSQGGIPAEWDAALGGFDP